MKNSINKEKWIDEVLESTKGMSRAEVPHDLFEQLTSKLMEPAKPKIVAIPAKQWIAAAILLLALNAATAVYYVSKNYKSATVVSSNPIALEIQGESTYNY